MLLTREPALCLRDPCFVLCGSQRACPAYGQRFKCFLSTKADAGYLFYAAANDQNDLDDSEEVDEELQSRSFFQVLTL